MFFEHPAIKHLYQWELAQTLRHWTCLRRFAFLGNLDCRWRWAFPGNPRYVHFLDDFRPPSRYHPQEALTVQLVQKYHLYPYGYEYQVFESEVRAILGLSEDAELDPAIDLNIIWEARHEVDVAFAVRYMAKCCPTLQEFVWYIGCVNERREPDSWHWKIHRKKDGKVNQVLGSLFWPESCRPLRPSFRDFSLVGDERKRAEEHGWSRMGFWPHS